MIRFIISCFLVFQSFFAWNATTIPSEKIQKIIDKTGRDKFIQGITLSLDYKGEKAGFSNGNLHPDSSYFMASVTKLYTAAIIFQLIDEGAVKWDDSIGKFLPPSWMKSLHTLKEIDYSEQITIRHLLTNTSGLPDYFEDQQENGDRLIDQLKENRDTSFTYESVVELTQSLPAHFSPGAEGQAHYSDGNFQLLGYIIEQVTQKTLSENYETRIFKPLNLTQTYLYVDIHDSKPTPFYYMTRDLSVPKMMASFRADGGLVTTSNENLKFLTAFFNGDLFSKTHLQIKNGWNKVDPPFQYGLGMMKFKYPGVPEMIGHAGATGSFAFWIPKNNLYLAGTINQIAKPQLVYKMLTKISAKMR